MRWLIKQEPTFGVQRQRWIFLFLPRKIHREWRWLELVKITEVFVYGGEGWRTEGYD